MWFVNGCFELHCGSPSPSEQRMPKVFTVTQIHGYPSLPEARRPSASWVTSWHPKLPPCGVPLRSPRGEMDHVAACCSWNGKHPRGCPAQRSPGFRRGRSSFLVLPLTVLESRGRGRVEGSAAPARPCVQFGLLFPDGDCQPLSASDTH